MSSSVIHDIPKGIIDVKSLLSQCIKLVTNTEKEHSARTRFFDDEKIGIQYHNHSGTKRVKIHCENSRFKQGYIAIWLEPNKNALVYTIANSYDNWDDLMSEGGYDKIRLNEEELRLLLRTIYERIMTIKLENK